MNCTWGTGWTGQYLHHNWTAWLVPPLLLGTAFLLHRWWREKQQERCTGCRAPVEEIFLRCPECGMGLKSHCPSCNRIISNSWQFCPHCRQEQTRTSRS